MAHRVIVLTKGFADSRKKIVPPPSPADFEWPGAPDKAQRTNFRNWINGKVREREFSTSDLARELYGSAKRGKGPVFPQRHASVHQWVAGKNFPRAATADLLGAYFDVPLAQIVGPKTNGHGGAEHMHEGASMGKGKRGALAPLPRLDLPKGAKAPVVKIETHATDPRFVNMSFTGVLQLDLALSVMALVHPRDH